MPKEAKGYLIRTAIPQGMDKTAESREAARIALDKIEKRYGFVPEINRIMSDHPDVFLPAVKYSKSVLENPDSVFDAKTRYLLSAAASSALGSPYCTDVMIKHAADSGATRDEVFEAVMIGCYMAMSRSQSIALREYDKHYPAEE